MNTEASAEPVTTLSGHEANAAQFFSSYSIALLTDMLWSKQCRPSQTGLTHNETNFTVTIIVATGHHGSHGVIDYSNNVNIKVLQIKNILCSSANDERKDLRCHGDWTGVVIITYPSLFDWLPQKAHHILSLYSTRPEGFGPRQQNTLRTERHEHDLPHVLLIKIKRPWWQYVYGGQDPHLPFQGYNFNERKKQNNPSGQR